LNRTCRSLKSAGPRIIVNIVGRTVEEYALVAAGLNGQEGVDGLEINISCPNIKAGGIAFGTDPDQTYQVVSAVRRQTNLPLLVKLSPNVTDITIIARAAEAAGADALSLINTLSGMLIDIETRRPLLGNTFGGLSGRAILPVALKMVWQTAEAVKIPLLGMGGISSARDALQFIMAGARAVAVGTALFITPNCRNRYYQGCQTI
jgi:dihydroorotate dehydrogenase (NAD+) catalytic subunit